MSHWFTNVLAPNGTADDVETQIRIEKSVAVQGWRSGNGVSSMSHHQARPKEKPIDHLRAPIERIIHLENMSGIALIAGAVVALVLANVPVADSVDHFWHTHLRISFGPIELDESLTHWINDGLMTIFFFVAGLEIKRELAVGDLRDPRTAALPGIAAIGGMVVPAGLYIAFSGAAFRGGWGVPMATDIAFAVGVLTLLGNRVPSRLKMLLLTLAIVDDLGAIVVIAVFYTASLNTTALLAAVGCLAGLVILRQLGVWWMPAYVLVGTALWIATFESGIHATLAGVVCGLLAPATPRRPDETLVIAPPAVALDELRAILFDTRETRSVVDRLIHALHPFTAFLIVPLFALANTGVALPPSAVVDAATSGIGQAIFIGLVLGKPLGIVGASWVAVRLGIATLPKGVRWIHMVGIGFLGGIGFTVSLFITDLAFEDDSAVVSAKIAILAASVAAATAGAVVLELSTRTKPDTPHQLGPIQYRELAPSTETVLPTTAGSQGRTVHLGDT
jgi:NhaA family Na+:H+ antiporter